MQKAAKHLLNSNRLSIMSGNQSLATCLCPCYSALGVGLQNAFRIGAKAQSIEFWHISATACTGRCKRKDSYRFCPISH